VKRWQEAYLCGSQAASSAEAASAAAAGAAAAAADVLAAAEARASDAEAAAGDASAGAAAAEARCRAAQQARPTRGRTRPCECLLAAAFRRRALLTSIPLLRTQSGGDHCTP